MKLTNLFTLGIIATFIVACDTSDDATETIADIKNPALQIDFEVPQTYVFKNSDGESTVSFGGQTTRLKQGEQIIKDLLDFNANEENVFLKFNEGQGFANASLNDTKKIKNKIAESVQRSADQAEIRNTFDKYISDQFDILLSVYNNESEVPIAEAGKAGKQVSATFPTRYVNAKGLELDQAFNKGLIGALTLDQIVNDYLTLTESASVQADNDAGKKAEGKPYTDAEHFWDEAYGYLYGASDSDVLDNPDAKHLDNVVDKFLYKYVKRVNDDKDFAGIANDIFQAFKTGRAAIVAKNYEVSKAQADVIRKKLSDVIGIRCVYYLKQGAKKISEQGVAAINDGSVFHDWSEGYGFIYSLQFTHNIDTGAPYFTKAEVEAFIAKLEANNGFWSMADNLEIANQMAEDIAARFDFTVAQAQSNDAAK